MSSSCSCRIGAWLIKTAFLLGNKFENIFLFFSNTFFFNEFWPSRTVFFFIFIYFSCRLKKKNPMITLTPLQWKAVGWSLTAIVVLIIILLAVFLHKKNQFSTPPPPQEEASQGTTSQGTFRPIPSYTPHDDDSSLPSTLPPWMSAPPRPVTSKRPDSPVYH
jgi:hypothetical protein